MKSIHHSEILISISFKWYWYLIIIQCSPWWPGIGFSLPSPPDKFAESSTQSWTMLVDSSNQSWIWWTHPITGYHGLYIHYIDFNLFIYLFKTLTGNTLVRPGHNQAVCTTQLSFSVVSPRGHCLIGYSHAIHNNYDTTKCKRLQLRSKMKLGEIEAGRV